MLATGWSANFIRRRNWLHSLHGSCCSRYSNVAGQNIRSSVHCNQSHRFECRPSAQSNLLHLFCIENRLHISFLSSRQSLLKKVKHFCCVVCCAVAHRIHYTSWHGRQSVGTHPVKSSIWKLRLKTTVINQCRNSWCNC